MVKKPLCFRAYFKTFLASSCWDKFWVTFQCLKAFSRDIQQHSIFVVRKSGRSGQALPEYMDPKPLPPPSVLPPAWPRPAA